MTDITNFGDVTLRDLTARSPTWYNPTASDEDEGRQISMDFMGKATTSGTHVLAGFRVNHEGGSDDQKGRLKIMVNDGAGNVNTAMTMISTLATTLHGAVTASSSLTVQGIATLNGNTTVGGATGLTVTNGLIVGGTADVSGAATFTAAGTSLTVTNNASVGGTLTVGRLSASELLGLDMDNLSDSATRQAISTGVQTISGTKTFSAALTASSDLTVGASGEIAYDDTAKTLIMDGSVVVRVAKQLLVSGLSSTPSHIQATDIFALTHATAPVQRCVRTNDITTSLNVPLMEVDFAGQRNAVYRSGAKILCRTDPETQWSATNALIAPSVLEFYVQDDSTSDTLSSPAMKIIADGTMSAMGNATVAGTLYANKATGESLSVASDASVTGNITCNTITSSSGPSVFTSITGSETLTLSGNTTAINCTGTGSSTFNAVTATTVTGSGKIMSTADSNSVGLETSGQSQLRGDVTASASVVVTGLLTANKASGTGLSVTSNARVGGTAIITGATSVGALTGTGTGSFAGTLTLSAAGTGLSVTNNATVGGTATITGATSVGALTGTSTGSFAGKLTCSAGATGLDVTNNATVGGTLAVTGTSTLAGNVTASGDVTAAGKFTSNVTSLVVGVRNEGISELVGEVKALVASGTGLTVTANAAIGGQLDLTRSTTPGQYALDAYGNVQCRDDLEVLQNLAVAGTATLTGNATAGGTFGVTGATTLSSTLGVTGASALAAVTASGLVTANAGVSTTTVTASGAVTANGAGTGLAVTNNATVGGTLGVTGVTTLSANLVGTTATLTDTLTLSRGSGVGLSVTSNANVGGDLTVTGDLTVNGTTTTINTETLVVEDNIIEVNKTPLSSKDSGILFHRLDTDITSDTAKENGSLTSSTASDAVLPGGMVGGADDYYNGWYIKITSNTPVGSVNQVRKITDYVHGTLTITLGSDWTTIPDAGSTFNLYNRPLLGFIYDESADEFVCCATVFEPSDTLTISEYSNLHVNQIITEGSTSFGDIITMNNATMDGSTGNDLSINVTNDSGYMRLRRGGGTYLQLTPSATVSILKATDINNTLTLSKDSGTGLGVTSNATIGGTLTVAGDTAASTATYTGAVGVGSLTVTNNATAASLTSSGTLTVAGTGDLDCDGAADFASTVTCGGKLTVNAECDFNSTLHLQGTSTFVGASIFNGGITAESNRTSVFHMLQITGTSGNSLHVLNGGANFQGGAVVNGSTFTSNAPVTINNTCTSNNTISSTKATGTGLNITANATIGGDLTVSGTLGMTGNVDVVNLTATGDVSFTKTGTALTVTNNMTAGSITTTGALTVDNTGNLDVDGTSHFSAGVTMTATLTGASAALSGTLGVTGAATFTAQSVHNGGIDVNAASDITSLTISGADTALTVTNNASIGGTLGVTGASTFTAQSVHNGGIDVNGNSDITNLTVSGAGSALTVTNTAALSVITVSNTSTFTGAATFNGNADFNGGSTTIDTLTVDGTGSALTVSNNTSLGGTLAVTGTSTFTGTSTHNGGITSAAESTFSQMLTCSKSSGFGLKVDSNAVVAGKVDIGGFDGSLSKKQLSIVNTGNAVTADPPTINFAFDPVDGEVNGTDIDTFGRIDFSAKDNNVWRTGARIQAQPQTAWSNIDPNQYKADTKLEFFVEDGTSTELLAQARMLIASNSIYTTPRLYCTSGVTSNSTSTLNGAVTVNNTMSVTDTVSLTKASGTGLAVTANATVGGNIGVTGTSTFTGGMTAGVINASGVVTLSAAGTALSVTNDVNVGGNLTVVGNLDVQGTTTTIDSTTLAVEDKNIELGNVDTPSDSTADGGGITLLGTTNKTITFDNSNSSWDISEHANLETDKEYRIADNKVLDKDTAYLGTGQGDGVIFLGNNTTEGSWRIRVSGGDLQFAKRISGAWVTQHTIS